MKFRNLSVRLLLTSTAFVFVFTGCNVSGDSTPSSSAASTTSAINTITSAIASGASGASGTSSVTTSTVNAIQIITSAGSNGSFDPVSVPAAGGVAVKASRIFGLDGSLIAAANIPTWFVDARVFLTSTRTSGTSNPSTPSGANTPCAYFDSYGDNNIETDGYYVIDGYNADNGADIDQCAGAAASEQNQLSIYIEFDRLFMNPTDKFQVVVKAKPIEDPNSKVTPTSCTTGGFFDATACSTQTYGISMRTAPGAPAKPFYILWPSAKSYDLLSESVIMPVNIDQSLTTISIDRAKGGAVFYGISIIRLQ